MSILESNDAEQARERSKERSEAFVAAIDPALSAREDRIALELAKENSSAKSKLRKLYHLVADFSEVSKPFVACGVGCSDCCKMNVSITVVEAEQLAAISGKPLSRVATPTAYPPEKFSGMPCPFLVDDACSVYDARPYACRTHVSFDHNAHWCHPDRSNIVDRGMVELSGAKEAYIAIASRSSLRGFADIRDFFSPAT